MQCRVYNFITGMDDTRTDCEFRMKNDLSNSSIAAITSILVKVFTRIATKIVYRISLALES